MREGKMNWFSRIDLAALAFCLAVSLVWSAVGVELFSISPQEMVRGVIMVFAGFYFGLWCKRNFG